MTIELKDSTPEQDLEILEDGEKKEGVTETTPQKHLETGSIPPELEQKINSITSKEDLEQLRRDLYDDLEKLEKYAPVETVSEYLSAFDHVGEKINEAFRIDHINKQADYLSLLGEEKELEANLRNIRDEIYELNKEVDAIETYLATKTNFKGSRLVDSAIGGKKNYLDTLKNIVREYEEVAAKFTARIQEVNIGEASNDLMGRVQIAKEPASKGNLLTRWFKRK